jgi:hypothetical protein
VGEIVQFDPLAATSEPKLAQAHREEQTVRLLIITDQKGSARLSKERAQAAARLHFGVFVTMLRELDPAREKTYLVKNIGDSLMIHLTLAANRIPEVLSKIIKTQNSVASKASAFSESFAVRVGVFLVDSDHVVNGDIIADDEHKDLVRNGVLPPRRWKSWLSGDLFGPSIALAFRASQLSSSTLLTVGESVVEKLREGNDNGEFSLDVRDGSKLFFSEALPFSPIKGFEETEPRAGWKGHFFLRAVTLLADRKRTEVLTLEQQKFRVWGRMLWDGDNGELPSQEQITEWNEDLYEMAGETSYLRSVSATQCQYHAIFSETEAPATKSTRNNVSVQKRTQSPPVAVGLDRPHALQSNSPLGKRRQFYKGYLPVGFIFAFASPTEATFTIFREKLAARQTTTGTGFVCALSTLVYSPSTEFGEGSSEFWKNEIAKPDQFILLLVRWIDRKRNDPANVLIDALREHVKIQRSEIALKTPISGRTIGGEWDVYVGLVSATPSEIISKDQFSALVKALEIELPSQHVYAVAAFLCDQSTFKSLAEERKNRAVSPDNLSPAI